MASLWDLINGYSQGGAPSEGSTQTLGQAARDIYRGLINPQQLQEVQRATQRTQKVIPSVLESLARGSIAQVPGTAGDISALLRQLSPETMQQLFGNRLAPTTDEILGYVPRMTPNYQGSESHEMMGGLLSPAMGYFAKAIPMQMKNMPIGNMIAYHGTPHEIQGGFDMAKIGTGEGAQAYGHGMYFAESPKVAESYKDLSKNVLYTPEGKVFDLVTELKHPNIRATLNKTKNIDDAIERAKELIKTSDPNLEDYHIAKKELDLLENYKKQGGLKTGEGNLYKVDIPDEHIATMMDWDKPLGQQSAHVKKAINAMKKHITPQMRDELGGDLNLLFGKDVEPAQFLNTWEIIHPESKVGIGEELLNKYGVKGIKYLDNLSRDAGQGTRNFVSFDPQAVKILEKNSKKINNYFGEMPHYKEHENLASVFEKNGLNVKETGSAHSNSRYVEITDPISGETFTTRFSNHPQSSKAMTLHGPADLEIGEIFKHKSWKDAINPILDRINKSRLQFGDELLKLK
jgi:hypothetical protein